MTIGQLSSWLDGHQVLAVAAAAAVLVAVLLARRALRGTRSEDGLTVLAAALATTVAMTGMWGFFGNVLHFTGPERVALFAFLEIAMIAVALRARRNMRKFRSAGAEGIAVWVLAGLSGFFSAFTADSFGAVTFRLCVPMVAAWLWHRAMSLERREATGEGGVHWRMTLERVLVRLGLAEPTERKAGDVAAYRRISQLAKAVKAHKMMTSSGAWAGRVRRAERVMERRLTAAVEHADLAVSAERQELLLSLVAALCSAASLADLDTRPPWEAPAEDPGVISALRAELEQTQASLIEALGMTRPDGALPAGAGAQPRLVLAASVAQDAGARSVFPPAGNAREPERRAPGQNATPPAPSRRSAAPAARTARQQPARTKAASAAQPPSRSRPATGPAEGDPPVEAIRAAVSAEQLAADYNITRWRAQQLRRPGSYAMQGAEVSA